jgi:hypothetical protein
MSKKTALEDRRKSDRNAEVKVASGGDNIYQNLVRLKLLRRGLLRNDVIDAHVSHPYTALRPDASQDMPSRPMQ